MRCPERWAKKMPKWSDMTHWIMPWARHHDIDTRRACAEATAIIAEQEALAPVIEEMTEYLVEKARVNGITRQLQRGFERRRSGQ